MKSVTHTHTRSWNAVVCHYENILVYIFNGGGSFPEGKAAELPSSAEFGKTWSCTSTPSWVFMAWCLADSDKFTMKSHADTISLKPPSPYVVLRWSFPRGRCSMYLPITDYMRYTIVRERWMETVPVLFSSSRYLSSCDSIGRNAEWFMDN
jgi:hypothetical protein